jgi:hypothetical protein
MQSIVYVWKVAKNEYTKGNRTLLKPLKIDTL